MSDLLDDTELKSAAAQVRPRDARGSGGMRAGVWWIAAAASLVWIATVGAFAWSRYALPSDPGAAVDVARSRIAPSDWLLLIVAVVGPLLLIWAIAWLVRRSTELRDESRRLARAAVLLADAAESAEKRADKLLPSGAATRGTAAMAGRANLEQEIKRAGNAMASLRARMNAMEDALGRQTSAFYTAAEKAEARVKALHVAGPGSTGPGSGRNSKNLAVEEDSEAAALVSDTGARTVQAAADAELAASDKTAEAVDLALPTDPPSQVERLRAGLLAAGAAASWPKLVPDGPAPEPAAAPEAAEDKPAPAAEMEPEDAEALDPFEDLVPPAAALGAGVTREVAAPDPAQPADESLPDEPPLSAPRGAAQDTRDTGEDRADLGFMGGALDWRKFVRAANFPESEQDIETLDALYEVLTDSEAAALLQSAEDVLASFADLDLYMEDFVPEMSPVSAWRTHLQGKEGEGVKGIDAPVEQSRVDTKIASDPDFRKMTERFVERFRGAARRLLREASEEKLLLDLADTRTGRAYLLAAGALGKL